MKIGLGTIYILLLGSLLAQTTNSFSQATAETEAKPDPAVSEKLSIDPAKEADIRRLMDLVGTRALVNQVMEGTEKSIKPLMTSSLPPGEYREKLIDLFFAKFHSKADPRQLLDLAVPVYDKYYSHEEIRGLIEFYETPLGQKTISVLPRLMGELQDAGRTWGGRLGRDSMMEVLAEHPDLQKALEAAKKGRPAD